MLAGMSDPFDCPKCSSPIHVRKPTDVLQDRLTLACSCQFAQVSLLGTETAATAVTERWGAEAVPLVTGEHKNLWLNLEQWAKATERLAAASG